MAAKQVAEAEVKDAKPVDEAVALKAKVAALEAQVGELSIANEALEALLQQEQALNMQLRFQKTAHVIKEKKASNGRLGNA